MSGRSRRVDEVAGVSADPAPIDARPATAPGVPPARRRRLWHLAWPAALSVGAFVVAWQLVVAVS